MTIRNRLNLGRFSSLTIINNRGTMLNPSLQMKDLTIEYDGIVFLRYLGQSFLG
jgi:hypothetical protein